MEFDEEVQSNRSCPYGCSTSTHPVNCPSLPNPEALMESQECHEKITSVRTQLTAASSALRRRDEESLRTTLSPILFPRFFYEEWNQFLRSRSGSDFCHQRFFVRFVNTAAKQQRLDKGPMGRFHGITGFNSSQRNKTLFE